MMLALCRKVCSDRLQQLLSLVCCQQEDFLCKDSPLRFFVLCQGLFQYWSVVAIGGIVDGGEGRRREVGRLQPLVPVYVIDPHVNGF